MPETDSDGPPAWDESLAAYAPGKYVVIGITYLDAAGEFLEQTQMHGLIQSADPRDGFAVALEGDRAGEVYWLPPDPRGFQPADPGEYRLRGTGEVIVDPDLLSTWTIYRPGARDDAAK
ncbi:hypothetical protein [Caulobacter sp. SSI4214]|jgi:hypothetical protein|uniref:hypothetical protein n=1 Tax=Caulobacter sp. SSI4214 TaxID=2575739 RepID=UPI001439425E|nr:hypothetical protein [Caulobacter sp. SSI4214]